MIWVFAEGKGKLVKVIQNKFFIYCGNISSVAFLLHTVVINYSSWIVNLLVVRKDIHIPGYIITGLFIPTCFILTIIVVIIWGQIGKN